MQDTGCATSAQLSSLSLIPNFHRCLPTTLAGIPPLLWEVQDQVVIRANHPAYAQYKSGAMSAAQLGSAYTDMWRAVMEDMQVQQLGGGSQVQEMLDEFCSSLAGLCAADPQPMEWPYHILLLVRK